MTKRTLHLFALLTVAAIAFNGFGCSSDDDSHRHHERDDHDHYYDRDQDGDQSNDRGPHGSHHED